MVSDLGKIADKQLKEKELNEDDRWYLENIVELVDEYMGPRKYNGWYPGLFYAGRPDSDKRDVLVADVQTTMPQEEFPYSGHTYHQAVGDINLLVIAIENGEDRVIYLGPTLSHYDFFESAASRLSDSEWEERLGSEQAQASPSRTEAYMYRRGK